MSEEQSMDIDYVSNLARIELSAEEKDKFQGQLGDVLKYFEKLQELDVEGVEPTAHAFPRFNVWDEDEAQRGLAFRKSPDECPEIKERPNRRAQGGRVSHGFKFHHFQNRNRAVGRARIRCLQGRGNRTGLP